MRKVTILLILLLSVIVTHAQQFNLTGTVVDKKSNEPIIGASVLIKGTSLGTITDLEGKFTLKDVSKGNVLSVSYVGYRQQDILLNGNQKTLSIQMEEDSEILDEVVVVGYGTQKKQDITGSVVSVGEGKFTEGVNTNAFQMINGKAAGVNVSQTSSAPGASTKIQIRGAGSINSSNSALVVVDGLPGVDPSSINPNDIKSIEVLKDASAAAIYGTRAANGVVLITTKTGKKGDMTVKFGAELGFQSVAKKIDVLNGQQYMETLNALRLESNNPEGAIYTADQIAAVGKGTNWQDEIFRTSAPVQNYQLSISGGGEKHDFYLGLSYFDQQGVVKLSNLKKYNIRANMNLTPKEFLRFKFNMNYTRSDGNSTFENMDGTNEAAGPINSALQFDPTLAPGIDPETGRYRKNSFIALDNPQALLYGISPEKQGNSVYGTFTTEIEPLKDLVATVRLGATIDTYTESSYRSRETMNGLASKGEASKKSEEKTQWLAEFLLSYKKNFNDIHKITILAGTTFEQFSSQYIKGEAKGFLSDVTGSNSMHSGDNLNGDDVYSFKDRNRLNGFLGRVNYDLMNKYLLTASFRYDGTSRFSKDHKYAFFPSVAFAWRISEEPFIKKYENISDLKLRIGYGQLGNQGIDNYQTLQTLKAGGSAVFGNSLSQGLVQARLPNPDLKWETTAESNIGIDFGFFNNRITGSLDFYIRDTKDQLFDKPLPSSIGFSNIKINAGKVRNSGIDLTLNTVNIDRKAWGWDTSLNLSFLKNEVKELPDFIPELITGSVASFISSYEITRVGDPIYSYYGYKVEGIFQKGDDIANSAQPNANPGELKFKNQNTDNVINSDDRVVLGKPFPDVTFGFTNSLRYKGFTLSVFVQGVLGIQTLDANVIETLYPTNEYRNRISKYYLNRWTENNPTNKYPSGVNSSNYGGQYAINSLTVVDASFVRIKNINLSYNIPMKKNKFIQSAMVYGAVDNLYTFTNYDGFDPDASASGNNKVSKVNYNSYPLARTVRFGVNITF
jgi:TonB-linked SusC/RagA family outer membrane protein